MAAKSTGNDGPHDHGSNQENAKSPEQRQGAGVFSHLKTAAQMKKQQAVASRVAAKVAGHVAETAAPAAKAQKVQKTSVVKDVETQKADMAALNKVLSLAKKQLALNRTPVVAKKTQKEALAGHKQSSSVLTDVLNVAKAKLARLQQKLAKDQAVEKQVDGKLIQDKEAVGFAKKLTAEAKQPDKQGGDAVHKESMKEYSKHLKQLEKTQNLDAAHLSSSKSNMEHDKKVLLSVMDMVMNHDITKVAAQTKSLDHVSKQLTGVEHALSGTVQKHLKAPKTTTAHAKQTGAEDPHKAYLVAEQKLAEIASKPIVSFVQVAAGAAPATTKTDKQADFEAAEADAMSSIPGVQQAPAQQQKPQAKETDNQQAQKAPAQHQDTQAEAEAKLSAAEAGVEKAAIDKAGAEAKAVKLQQQQKDAETQAEKKEMAKISTAPQGASGQGLSRSALEQQAEMAAQQTVAAAGQQAIPGQVASPQQAEAAAQQTVAAKSPTQAQAAVPAAMSPENQALLEKQAEVAAQEKVAWEQKQKDVVNMQKEQKAVEKAEIRHAKFEKPPSEVAKASAEIEAEHILAKERATEAAHAKKGKAVLHKIDGPKAKSVVHENAKPAPTMAVQSPTTPAVAQAASESPKTATKPSLDKLAKKAEELAEKTVVHEDNDKEEAYRHTVHGVGF